ncbi:carboxymuconolactone decarboxylase family protein [Humibacter sp. RRB41]|uniref:carboxymuconolactone decarboxylase family protein n=1 Tax=Humibacter sp. RRB41 TaxID=2919946 RepID=UPI001FAADC24|nr:carboxymuconolactone decarboxylase family protein [Humibacter sp. RRB41]
MSIVKTVREEDATGEVAKIYGEDIEEIGYVPSHTRVMALNPQAVRAFEGLVRTIALPLGKRNYELVTLAAARGLRSQHCLLAHGRKSLAIFAEPDLIRIAEDYHDAGLTEAEVTMMEYAEKVSTASSAMTDADSRRLRDVGFSDADIVNITLAAAVRNYYSRAIQALAVDVDVPAELSPGLKDALVGSLQ